MNNNQSRCPQLERPLRNLSYIERRVIDGAPLLNLIGNQHVFRSRKKKPKLLNLFMRYGCATIVDKLLPRGDGIALLRLDLQQPTSNDFRKFESRYRRVVHARNTLQLFRIGADHRCKIAELIQ